MSPTISSRTPEGWPNECPLCGAVVQIEPSTPTGDAPCPACGGLLWFYASDAGLSLFDATEAEQTRQALNEWLTNRFEVSPAGTSLDPLLDRDSLETVELVMELEEYFSIDVHQDEARRIRTISDAIAFILRHRKPLTGE